MGRLGAQDNRAFTLISEVRWFDPRFLFLDFVRFGYDHVQEDSRLAPVASLVSIHHLRPRVGLVGLVAWWGYHVYLRQADTLKSGLRLDQ